MLSQFMLAAQVVLALFGAYQLMLAFFAYRAPKKPVNHAPQKSFAVLIAAHNEEQVVGALIENLKQMKYPKELFDIFVIADNCTDGTADIARSMGVYACERTNPTLRGKGYAIEWMLKELWRRPRQYDAVVMFDADNLVSEDFLQHMNDDLCNGAQVIQGYLDTKNPHDSWITASFAISYWYSYRLLQLPRRNLKLPSYLGGTGMCFAVPLLKEMGWGATSLVEDLEFSMRCVQRGVNPVLNYHAKVFDEKPLTFKASWNQRLRWMQGHFEVARKFFFPLLWQGIKEGSWKKLDAALVSVNVYNLFLGSIFAVTLWICGLAGVDIASKMAIPPMVFNVLSILIYAQFAVAIFLEKAPKSMYKWLLSFLVFMFSWWPITFYAFFTQNNKQWSHTQHTRVIRLEDMRGKQAGSKQAG